MVLSDLQIRQSSVLFLHLGGRSDRKGKDSRGRYTLAVDCGLPQQMWSTSARVIYAYLTRIGP